MSARKPLGAAFECLVQTRVPQWVHDAIAELAQRDGDTLAGWLRRKLTTLAANDNGRARRVDQ
jgi:predicted HicB family RNase H-like nuclease